MEGKEKERSKTGCELSICFEHFCIMSQVEAINKPTTGTLSPRKTGQSSRKTQAKLCPYMGAILLPATVAPSLPPLPHVVVVAAVASYVNGK